MSHQFLTILQNFKIIRPQYELNQANLLKWLGSGHAQVEALKCIQDEGSLPANRGTEFFTRLFERFGCSPSRIGHRGTEISDSLEMDLSRMEIFSPTPLSPINEHPSETRSLSGAGFSTRTRLYNQVAQMRVHQLFESDTAAPDHFIHVTCTGYSSPSPVQVLVSKRGWNQHSRVTHAYHMGCYASLPAVRIADGFRAAGLAHGLKRIDIVHTEICSLHLNLADHSPEQMVVQSLFADGHIRYSAVSSESAEPGGLELVTIHEEILPNTLDFMTWQTSEWGMRMTLSKEVPKQLAASIQGFISRMLTHAQLENPHFLSEAIFAIHPGGPRIIDQLQAELNLREEQVSHSKKILFDYGNMSSATLPHIWNSILGDTNIPAGKWIVSLAFGPGLTAFGALMRKRES